MLKTADLAKIILSLPAFWPELSSLCVNIIFFDAYRFNFLSNASLKKIYSSAVWNIDPRPNNGSKKTFW